MSPQAPDPFQVIAVGGVERDGAQSLLDEMVERDGPQAHRGVQARSGEGRSETKAAAPEKPTFLERLVPYRDFLMLLGGGSVVYGIYQLTPAGAWIAMGAALILLSWMMGRQTPN